MKGAERGRNSRVLRGGSWNNEATNCRAAYRNRNAPDTRNNTYGFRLVFRLHDHGSSLDQCRESAGPRSRREWYGSSWPLSGTPACFGGQNVRAGAVW